MKKLKFIPLILLTLIIACQGNDEKKAEPVNQKSNEYDNREQETTPAETDEVDPFKDIEELVEKEKEANEKEQKTIQLSDLKLPDDIREFLEAEKEKDSIVFEFGDRKYDLTMASIVDIIYNFPKITDKSLPDVREVINFSESKRLFPHAEHAYVYLVYAYLQYNIHELTNDQWDAIYTYLSLEDLARDFAYAQLIRGNFGYEYYIMAYVESLRWVLHDMGKKNVSDKKYNQERTAYLNKVEKRGWLNFEDRLPYEYYDDEQEAEHRKKLENHIALIKSEIDNYTKLQIFKKLNFTIEDAYMERYGISIE